MRRLFGFCALFVACVVSASAQEAKPQVRFTLDDCVNYAMGDNLTRRSMELSLRSAELDASQARLDRLPNLSASASGNLSHQNGERRTTGASYGANSGMTLWQGGQLNQVIKQSDIAKQQAGARVAQFDNTLAINIMSSYFAVKGYEELQRYQQSLIEVARAQVRDGLARFHEQTMVESDFMMLDAQLAQNLNQAEQTAIDIDNELRNLKTLMSMDEGVVLALEEPADPSWDLPERDDFITAAEAASPDLELLRYGVNIAQTSLKISRAGFFPTLSASGSVGTGHSGFHNVGSQMEDRFSQSAGLSLSVPLFNRNRTRTNVQKAQISLQQAELERRQGEIETRQSLQKSYSDAVTAKNSFATMQVRETAYRRSLESYRAQYAEGAIKPVDLLQQENNYINIMYEFVQSKYSLLLRKGILNVYMHK